MRGRLSRIGSWPPRSSRRRRHPRKPSQKSVFFIVNSRKWDYRLQGERLLLLRLGIAQCAVARDLSGVSSGCAMRMRLLCGSVCGGVAVCAVSRLVSAISHVVCTRHWWLAVWRTLGSPHAHGRPLPHAMRCNSTVHSPLRDVGSSDVRVPPQAEISPGTMLQ